MTEPPPDELRTARPRSDRWTGYAWAVLTTAIATGVGWPLYHGFHLPRAGHAPVLQNTNVLMFYLLGVLWVATRHGRGAATLASVLGVLAFDLCFVPPYLRFSAHDPQYLVTFAVMLSTALVIGTLTHRVRQQADAARDRERRTATLLALSRGLAAARATDEVVAATVRHVRDVIGGRAVMLLLDEERRLVQQGDSAPEPIGLGAFERASASRALEDNRPSGAPDGETPTSPGTYFRLGASRGSVGVLGVLPEPGGNGQAPALTAEQRQLLESFASQAALALERAALADEAKTAWERAEAEFVRNTLLAGVSHDLRTPLAAITGAVSSLTETGDRLPPEARREMLETIYEEAGRMERLVNNLLDMTRLESGGLVLRKEWHPLQEVVGSALRHLDRRLAGRQVRADVPPDLPLVHVDGVALEQVLVNLIDNAIEYTPPDTPVEIVARVAEAPGEGGDVVVEVADRGPGLPPGTEDRVFDKFFRARAAEGQARLGVGLGLAICRGIVEAHGGRIVAANRPGGGGGAVFRFSLPSTGTPPTIDSAA